MLSARQMLVALSLIVLSGVSHAQTGIGLASGAAVPAPEMQARLGVEPIFARLPVGDALALYGREFRAAEEAGVVVGLSAQAAFVAVLFGAIEASDGSRAAAGRTFFMTPGSASINVATFDARRLQQTVVIPDTAAEEALSALAERQRSAVFWGRLQRSGLNLRAPGGAEVAARDAVTLIDPVVASLRLAHAEPSALTMAVVERFANALRARDAQTIAALLHPGLFIVDAERGIERDVLTRRRAAANALLQEDWGRLTTAQIELIEDATVAQVSSGGRLLLRLALRLERGMPFVAAVETVP